MVVLKASLVGATSTSHYEVDKKRSSCITLRHSSSEVS